jgi:hypothetical protein
MIAIDPASAYPSAYPSANPAVTIVGAVGFAEPFSDAREER